MSRATLEYFICKDFFSKRRYLLIRPRQLTKNLEYIRRISVGNTCNCILHIKSDRKTRRSPVYRVTMFISNFYNMAEEVRCFRRALELNSSQFVSVRFGGRFISRAVSVMPINRGTITFCLLSPMNCFTSTARTSALTISSLRNSTNRRNSVGMLSETR